MTKIFQTVRNGKSTMSFILARNEDDARAFCVEAGQVACHVDVEICKDVTAEALQKAHMPETLKAHLDAGRRGNVYLHPEGWIWVPLAKDRPALHGDATMLEACPRCHVSEGEPCISNEEHPVMEGTAHRVRVRLAIVRHPEILE
jgi:hypothetical protein